MRDVDKRSVFYIFMFLLAMKYGIFIAVQVFQINLIYGLIIGTPLGLGMIWFFRKFFMLADRAEIRRKCRYTNWNWRVNGFMHANRDNPWYVGLNDVFDPKEE